MMINIKSSTCKEEEITKKKKKKKNRLLSVSLKIFRKNLGWFSNHGLETLQNYFMGHRSTLGQFAG